MFIFYHDMGLELQNSLLNSLTVDEVKCSCPYRMVMPGIEEMNRMYPWQLVSGNHQNSSRKVLLTDE